MIPFTRQDTSKRRLKVRWNYPSAKDEELLDLQGSIEELRGDDPRPLLIIRECGNCKGSDKALFNIRAKNEKARLMTRWFHCIKLPPYITDPSHRWHSLFTGKRPAHGLIVSWDGKKTVPLSGAQSQKTLHDAMVKILRTDYKRDPARNVSRWFQTLSHFDHLDVQKQNVTREIEAVVERHGPKAKKLKALQKKKGKIERQIAKALEQEKQYANLELKRGGKIRSHSVLLEEIRNKKDANK